MYILLVNIYAHILKVDMLITHKHDKDEEETNPIELWIIIIYKSVILDALLIYVGY